MIANGWTEDRFFDDPIDFICEEEEGVTLRR